ncbi:MAG: ectoine hydrolase DoeA [Pseudomonadota bacterium]
MPDVDLPFTRNEYAARLANTRTAMAEAGLDALLVSDPSNMAWLTGYDGWSFYVHQGVVLTLDDEPLWWGRNMDAAGARRTVYMDEDHILGYHDDFVQSTERHPMQDLANALKARGLERSRIGVEMENYYFSAAAWETLKTELPDVRWQDATALVNWQRIIKSPAEIALMRKAARIVELMHAEIRARFAPGVRKNDLVAEIYRTAIRGTADAGGDYPAIVPLLPTGLDATAAHLTWNDKPLERGAGTFFEIAGVHRRYHLPLCRTAYLGKPPQRVRDAERAVLDGVEAGLDAARAGNTTGDIARAFYGVLERAGIRREGRCGYAIGLSYPPDWGERTASIRPSDQTELQPGMTFHFMPGLWLDDFGLEITESILVGLKGPAEPLADVPRELFVRD